MKTVSIYIRVSTQLQELENQLNDLKAYCKKNNWQVFKVYSDIVTGKETKEDKRPGFTSLFQDAHKMKFEAVLFWDLSRFSRAGTLYTLQKLQELKNLGIDWISYNESYISSLGQFSDVVISIMSTLAKLEREKISERTKSGLRTAKLNGKQLGRPAMMCDKGHKKERVYIKRVNGKNTYLYICNECKGVPEKGGIKQPLAFSRNANNQIAHH
jgi:DNA invertase Pin-like site-specific DNA recombinase